MLIPAKIVPYDQKSHITPHYNCLDLRDTMVLFVVSSASYDTNTANTNATPMMSHDQKVMLLPHFDWLYLQNAKKPLMMLQAVCEDDADTNGIT